MLRLAAALAVSLVVLAGWSGQASAQGRELQEAQEAYAGGEYERVRELLEPGFGGVSPRESDPFIVRDARRYLGAAYVLLDRTADAENQFTWLLSGQPLEDLRTQNLDGATFIQEVQTVFNRVRDAQIATLEAEVAQDVAAVAERARRQREAQIRLLALAQGIEATIEVDPLPTYVPFGVGQFTNGSEGLGWFFAITEALTLLGSIAAFSTWIALDDQNRRADNREPGIARVDAGVLDTFFGLTYGLGGAFGVLAIAGVVEARISFQPTRTRRFEQEIPQEVIDDLQLSLGVGRVSLSGRFW